MKIIVPAHRPIEPAALSRRLRRRGGERRKGATVNQRSDALALVIAAAILAGQILISGWWMRRYRFGPAEWLWRTLTYGARQPLRRAAA